MLMKAADRAARLAIWRIRMFKKSLAALAVVLGASATTAAPAQAVPGYAVPRLEVKAGPGYRYPTVAVVRYDSPLEVNGCLRNWSWCDVTTRRGRGWVRGRDIEIERRGSRIEYGAPWGVPQFDFNLDTYWNNNYRGQEFYRERDRWRRYDGDDYGPGSGSGYGPGSGSGYGPDSSYRGDDRARRWQQRYSRTYTYNDDVYYRDCRNSSDPAGILAGAVIGGLIGNAAGGRGDRGVGTVAGVIVGGAAGAALTRRMECEDRSYAYRTYSQALNSGRENSNWTWRNQRNGHYGEFTVNDYYNDPDGFRCATYTQEAHIGGRREVVDGNACQQPDGSWAIVN
jgi:uncharacterized protein YraI/surface antigen